MLTCLADSKFCLFTLSSHASLRTLHILRAVCLAGLLWFCFGFFLVIFGVFFPYVLKEV